MAIIITESQYVIKNRRFSIDKPTLYPTQTPRPLGFVNYFAEMKVFLCPPLPDWLFGTEGIFDNNIYKIRMTKSGREHYFQHYFNFFHGLLAVFINFFVPLHRRWRRPRSLKGHRR